MAVADNIELLRQYAAGGSEEGFGASTSTPVKGTLKLMTQTKLRRAAVVCTSFLLTAAAATAVVAQVIAKSAQIQLPPEMRQQWEKQKVALRAVYIEFTETSRGILTNWDYVAAPAYSAYFAGSHIYQHERIPGAGYAGYEREVAFDGQTIWRRNTDEVSKCSLADAPALLSSRLVRWPYLDAAGIYAPEYISELGRFSSLEPLALHYLKHSEPTKVEAVGENLRLTFQLDDE